MTQQTAQSTSEQHISENDLIAQRHAKLKQIQDHAKETGVSPWPNTFKREHYAQDLQEQFAGQSKEQIEAGEQVHVSVAGRVMLNRGSFIVIQDMTGRIQLYVPRKELAPEVLETVKSLDLGDIIAVQGYIGRSGKGDLYVHIEHFELLTKSLRPLPDKFHGLNDTEVKMYGVEATGDGIETGRHSAPLAAGRIGVLHGNRTYLMADDEGQIQETHSISAGLDYPGVGPEHSFLKDMKRVEYVGCTDKESLEGFHEVTRKEGIIPALESAHAVAYALKLAKTMTPEQSIIVNMSGRGDKDLHSVMKAEGIEL